MRLKRSGKVMLVSFIVLVLFSGMVVWHNRAPDSLTQQETQRLTMELSRQNAGLKVFIHRIEQLEPVTGFYSLGLSDSPTMPTKISRACYSDPLLARVHAKQLGISSSENIRLIRYRSLEDFLELLLMAEKRNPGRLAKIDFRAHRAMAETPLSLSLELLSAVFIGFLGVLLVKSVPE